MGKSILFAAIAIPVLITSISFSAQAACDPISLFLSSNAQNYNVYNAAVAAGWNSVCQPVKLTIGSGVYVWSDSTSLPALDTAGFPSGTQLTIDNRGYVMGRGGDGGYFDLYALRNTKGQDGGPAMNLTVPTTLLSSDGYILGGGGGTPILNMCLSTSGGGGAGGGNGSASKGFFNAFIGGVTIVGGADAGAGGAPGHSGQYGLLSFRYPGDTYTNGWVFGGGGGRTVPGAGGADRFCAKVGPNGSGYCGGCSSGDGSGAGYGGSGGGGGGGGAGTDDSGACDGLWGRGGSGGSGGASGSDASYYGGGGMVCSEGGGGGGGWGAPGGSGSDMITSYYGLGPHGYGDAHGGAGGHSIHTNCNPVTWVGGFPSSRVFGSVTRNQTQGLETCPATGTVNVSANVPGAAWIISGPAMILGSGVTATYPGEPIGTYTIIWSPVAGYLTPASQSLTIAGANAIISFIGNYTPISNADLVAGPVTPSVVAANSLTVFSSTISNIGTDPTSDDFPIFFQTASGSNGTGTIMDLPSSNVAMLSAGGSVQSSASYVFPSPGTKSMRVCADAKSSIIGGVIGEMNESNNCGVWTDIIVQEAPVISFTINGSSGPLSLAQGAVETMDWNVDNATTCTAFSSDTWSGSKALPIGTSSQIANRASDFSLSCTGPGGSASKTIHVDVFCTPSVGVWGDCDCSTEKEYRTNINASCLPWIESQDCNANDKNTCRDFSWKETIP